MYELMEKGKYYQLELTNGSHVRAYYVKYYSDNTIVTLLFRRENYLIGKDFLVREMDIRTISEVEKPIQ